MRPGRGRRTSVGVLLAAVAAVTACGGDGGARSTAKPAAEPAPSASAVQITAPDDGSTVRGRALSAGAVTAPVTLSGHADALQVVRVDGRCKPSPCAKFAYTGAEGSWKARLRLVVPPRTRRWTVTADYAVTPTAATSATLTLAVRATKAKAKARSRRDTQAPEAEPGAATTQTQPPTTSSTPAPSTPAPSSGAGGALVLVGDSLAVGVRDLLPAALPGWKVQVLARTGRPLAEGMGVVSGLDLSGSSPPVLAVSLFTNDDPGHTSALQAAVRRTLSAVGPRGCAIWATIVRPPVNGVDYRAANALLARLAAEDPRLRLVPWAAQVAANPKLVGADGVHPTPEGYKLRAQLYAQAAQSCG